MRICNLYASFVSFFFLLFNQKQPFLTCYFLSDGQTQDNNDTLAYWLSNASTLLLLLQRTLKASGAAGMAPQRRRSSSATLFGRMTQVCVNDCERPLGNLDFLD